MTMAKKSKNKTFCVAALYHFADMTNLSEKQARLQCLCENVGIKGTLLLADEGINGTIAGPRAGIDTVIEHIQSWPEIDALNIKYSRSSSPPFLRMKVRLKPEIVTMGKPGINPACDAGTYVEPDDWNTLIKRDDLMLIDTRNCYETSIGSFEGAVDPKTDNFRDFPDWADQLAANPDRPRAVAMYCTGGIRCEKASAYMKQLGFEEVYHLKGGILKYLEQIEPEKSLWQGECFVFDERVSLGPRLTEGNYDLCHACRHPISAEDMRHPDFEKGISCHHCAKTIPSEKLSRLRERQYQVTLAQARGEEHIGSSSASASRHKNAQKNKKRKTGTIT